MSFRIRFSGEESDLIETDSCQGTPSRLPPRAHPASSRPSGATATARSSALPLIKIRQRMAKEPLSRTPGSVVCNFGDMPTPAFRGAGEPHVGRAPSPANIIRRCADNEGSDIGKAPR